MLFSTLATVASLVGLALAAPAVVDAPSGLVARGGRHGKVYEPVIHKVTVGK